MYIYVPPSATKFCAKPSFILRIKPTLFAERGGRGTGERQTVPPYTERMVLLEVPLEMLEVALHWQKRHETG